MAGDDITTIENALKRELSIILNLGSEVINGDTPLADLGFDSMSFVELLVFIEKKYKIKLMQSGLKKEDFYAVKPLALCIAKEIKAGS